MRIETGSQNASRIPGNYAYVQQRYNQSAVESVGRIRGEDGRALREAAAASGRPHPNPEALMRDPIYEVHRSTRAARFIGATGNFVDRFA